MGHLSRLRCRLLGHRWSLAWWGVQVCTRPACHGNPQAVRGFTPQLPRGHHMTPDEIAEWWRNPDAPGKRPQP